MKIHQTIAKFFLSLLLIGNFAWALDMNPGKYKVTTQMQMPGMNMPAQTISYCLTKENAVPNKTNANAGQCAKPKVTIKGNTVIWTVECSQGDYKTKSKGEITYNGDSFNGNIVTEMQGGMTAKITMKGKRIGACK